MAKKSMGDYAKGWKSPEERKEAKMAARAADKPKGKSGKNSPDSKGPGPDDYMKGMKKPKGGGK